VTRTLGRAWRRARATLDVFETDQCAFLAGAVAYQLFFAIVPLLALTIGVLGFVYGSDRANRELAVVLYQIYPVLSSEELVIGEAAKLLFGIYAQALGAFAAYGSLAFFAGLLTWIYLTAIIILIGAEAVKIARASNLRADGPSS
jgi:uncharacterized BrkB/YihY/UPF0761 family membrane protein